MSKIHTLPEKLYTPKDCEHLACTHPAGGECCLMSAMGEKNDAVLVRAIATYNACAGIHDPAAAIQAAREALAIPDNVQREGDIWSVHPGNFQAWKKKLKEALNLLTPAP